MADSPQTAQQSTQQATLNIGNLNVHVRSPEQNYFEGEAKALSSINEKGPFDILPGHENFISIIKDKLVVYPIQGDKKDIPCKQGVLKVDNNNIHIFLGIESV